MSSIKAGITQVGNLPLVEDVLDSIVETLQKESPEQMFFVSEITRKMKEILEDPENQVVSTAGNVATICRQTCSKLLDIISNDSERGVNIQEIKEQNRTRKVYFYPKHYMGPARVYEGK